MMFLNEKNHFYGSNGIKHFENDSLLNKKIQNIAISLPFTLKKRNYFEIEDFSAKTPVQTNFYIERKSEREKE